MQIACSRIEMGLTIRSSLPFSSYSFYNLNVYALECLVRLMCHQFTTILLLLLLLHQQMKSMPSIVVGFIVIGRIAASEINMRRDYTFCVGRSIICRNIFLYTYIVELYIIQDQYFLPISHLMLYAVYLPDCAGAGCRPTDNNETYIGADAAEGINCIRAISMQIPKCSILSLFDYTVAHLNREERKRLQN